MEYDHRAHLLQLLILLARFFTARSGDSTDQTLQFLALPPSPAPSPLQEPPPSSSPASSLSGCGVCGISYQAGIGDTFHSVAEYCNVPLSQLLASNPKVPVSNITGSVLTVPCTGQDPADCGVCGSSYIIQDQDSLAIVAFKCGIDLQTIETANLGIDYDVVFQGQFIRIPCGEQNASRSLQGCGVCGITYKAPEEENLENVVQICGSTDQALRALNPAVQPNSTILAGQELNIPCTGNYSQHCGLCGTNYTPSETETFQIISAKCRVGIISLEQENPGIAENNLSPGMTLKIPCPEVVRPVCSPCNGSTQVLPNETTLSDVAQRCNVSIDLLLYANSISKLQPEVMVGQTLFVPCATMGKQENSCSICGSSIALQVYVGLPQIAEACHLAATDIVYSNPYNVNLTLLGPGDLLKLPCTDPSTGCGVCGVAYETESGDTLQSVAVKCAIMASQIQDFNPGINFTMPINGTTLTMPCAFTESSSSSAAGVLWRTSERVLFPNEQLETRFERIPSFLLKVQFLHLAILLLWYL